MGVVSKTLVDAKIKQLDEFYLQLKEVLEGKPVDEGSAAFYVTQPENAGQLVQIDLDKLRDAIGHFKVSVESLRTIKAVKPSKEPWYGVNS